MAGQPLPAPQDASLQVAISAGFKATAKQAADLWYTLGGSKYFIGCGGFNMQEEVTRPLLPLALDEVAYVSEAVTKQLPSVSV